MELKEHQAEVVLRLRLQRGLLLWHALGSGKTLTAVAAAVDFLERRPRGKVVVITPKSLQTNFLKELRRWEPDAEERFELYTFEAFARSKKYQDPPSAGAAPYMLVVDEAHNLRTVITRSAGTRARAVVQCARWAQRVLLLTATPLVNEPYDISNLMCMLDGENNISKKEFERILGNPAAFRYHFANKVSFYSPDEKEIEENYPATVKREIFLQMSAKYLVEYEKVEQAADYTELFANPTIFYNGVRRASNALDNSLDNAKIQWLLEFLEKQRSRKTIVFSNWLGHGLELIRPLLRSLRIPYAFINGTLSKNKRQEAVKLYNESRIRVLLISKAGGEGLDLHETNNMVLMDPGWNQALTDQVVGRGVRYKSHTRLDAADRVVNVYHLYLIKPHEMNNLYYAKVNNARAETRTRVWSIDMYLRALALHKQMTIDRFTRRIQHCN